jgi:leucyl-tRNA synthetase
MTGMKRNDGSSTVTHPSSAYDHTAIEAAWQKIWEDHQLNVASIEAAARPFYNLMMFPYPSAEGLHVGNMYAFTGSDVYGRFKRLQGYDVFEPIGLDGFGIHSENYALKVGRHPMDHAAITEKNFYNQLRKIGSMFDWTRTVETYDTDYYRWTQWLFVQMFEHGLAYRGRAEVNFCPSCKTVLADEQVIDEKCERCGNIVEKRSLEQWFFKITAYAEKLLQNSFSLDWSEKVKVAQKNWIGKKEGINITYPVVDESGKSVGEVTCFTTRPDTNFGATFVVIAPEHPFISQVMRVIKQAQADRITRYCEEAKKATKEDREKAERKKTGVATGLYCVNQLNGAKMPLYISDFVLMSFGTGAVVGVPGHDMRDFEFAQTFGVPIIRVVKSADGDTSSITNREQVQEEEGIMMNSDFLDGMDIHDATFAMMDHLEKKGWGKRVVTYHLRDWLLSRQRYWGPPIPMIHCAACESAGKGTRADMPGWFTVPVDQLPVVLPRIEDYKPGDDGVAPLAKHTEFYETVCPGCGGKAVRETDVSDTFLDSSWYFLRYPSLGAKSASTDPFDPSVTKKWLPVHMYTGGAEHSVLHLMYSRFVTMALKDWGYIDFEEPFSKFYAHGLVIKDGAKMSKSKGNVVNPDEYIKLYGADSLRLYLMFMGPFDQGGDFRDSAMEGMSRWVGRIWRFAHASATGNVRSSEAVHAALHKLIKKVGDDLERRRYNTAIASMMEFTNLVAQEKGAVDKEDVKQFLILLAPFAPHVSEQLWSEMAGIDQAQWKLSDSVHRQGWPTFDPALLVESSVSMVIQVNGKVRDTIEVNGEQSTNQTEVERIARASVTLTRHVDGKTIKKVIFVPGKIINFVVA